MDAVEKLSVGVAKMELEHHARGEVIENLREEREDHRAASLRIRTLLAPLLGVDVNNEPADEMVGRFVALYEARDERVAEQRGHDKAMEWAATLAFDFDPFSEDWTDEQRGAGERVLGLFAERLRDEVARQQTKWVVNPAMEQEGMFPSGIFIDADGKPVSAFVSVSPLARGTVTGVETASSRCIRDDGVELKRTETGFVDDRPYAGGPTSWSVADRAPKYAPNDWTPCEVLRFYLPRSGYVRLKAGAMVDGGQMGVSVDGGQEPGFVSSMGPQGMYSVDREVELSEGWHTFALMGRQGARVTDRTLSVAVVGAEVKESDLPGMATVHPSEGFYRVYDSNQTGAEEALYVKVTKDGVVWGYSEYGGVPEYRTLGRPWVSFATEPGNERMRWMPDRDRVAEKVALLVTLRTWNPPLVPAPSPDGGLTQEEVAAVRALLKREGK